MTFENLPTNWPELPLTDPVLAADVVDLALGHQDRLHNSMLVLLCDDDLRVLQPCMIDGLDWNCTARLRRDTFRFLTHLPLGGVIIAISSRRQLPADVADRWLRAAHSVLAEDGPPLLHFFSAAAGDQPELVRQSLPPGLAS